MSDQQEHTPPEKKDSAFLVNDEGFALPAEYFQQSAQRIRYLADSSEDLNFYPGLQSLKQTPNTSGLSVPEKYFEQRESSLENIPYSELIKLNGVMFSVPDTYFEKQKNKLTQQLNAHTKPKLVFLFRKYIVYAAAAVLLVSLGLWWYHASSAQMSDAACNSLACIDQLELLQTLSEETYETEELYELISPADWLPQANAADADSNYYPDSDSSFIFHNSDLF